METNTHKVKKITVTENNFGHFKTINVNVVSTVPRYCLTTYRHVREEVETSHTFFTENLDLKVEVEALELVELRKADDSEE